MRVLSRSLVIMVKHSATSVEDIAYSNASNLMLQAVVVFGIALAVTVLRCYVRFVMLKAFGKDDWTTLVSMVRNNSIVRPTICC
jgi:uncharacterized membrane protein (DUF485 family)